VWQLYRKNVDTGQPEEQLTRGPEDKIAPEWSRDGRYLVFVQVGTTTAEDIFAMTLDGDRQPFPVLQTPAIETNPSLSPDGQWLAFESSYTGRPEVYVMRFPSTRNAAVATPPRWQVSTMGGSRPRWSGDGHALYYVSLDDLRLLKAEVRPNAATFENDAPQVFAEIPVMSITRAPFDVAADGRLLVLERTINQSVPLAIIMNWRALVSGH
jgi:TolB protein